MAEELNEASQFVLLSGGSKEGRWSDKILIATHFSLAFLR